jgi:2-hydroxychromene-2-carboxylate isomerase
VRDIADHRFVPRVEEEFHSGVTGTPTFFINGVLYEGDYDLKSLLAAVSETAEPVR